MTQTKRHIRPKKSGPTKTFFGQKKWSGNGRTGRTADDGLVLTVEAIPEEGMRGGGVPVPLFPERNWLVPLLPKNRKLAFLCSLYPNIVFVPLKIGLCSP